MSKNIEHVQHLKSSVVIDGSPKLPNPSALTEGEIAVNFAKGYETLSIKNDSGNVVTFSSDNHYSEKKLGSGFTGEYSGMTVTEAIENSEYWTSGTGENAVVLKNSSGTASGNFSVAEGYQTSATSNYSHAEGGNTLASGVYSHAEGMTTSATSNHTHAEGMSTLASGPFSHAEGSSSKAIGSNSHAEGNTTSASNEAAHAEGSNTVANAQSSHAEGMSTSATGYYSHSEGQNTTASGSYGSHAEGSGTLAAGGSSHSEGSGTQASGDSSHAEGQNTKALGGYSHAEGQNTTARGSFSHSEGSGTQASGDSSHAEGQNTIASGNSSHAEGHNSQANNIYAHAEGNDTRANGNASHSEGQYTIASGQSSHAEGASTIASGQYSHAEGASTTASGDASHAEGYNTIASGYTSHAEGASTIASGDYSHAEGVDAQANGESSHAEGEGTEANNKSEHASGQYNISSSASTTFGDSGNTLFSVGNGTDDDARHNAFEIRQNGDIYISSGSADIKLQDHLGGGFIELVNPSAETKVGLVNKLSQYYDTNIGKGAVIEGDGYKYNGNTYNIVASGDYSHAEGYKTTASGNYSHAEGGFTQASSTYSHAEGEYTQAIGIFSHAEGYHTFANGEGSHTEGENTTANNKVEHASGQYNVSSIASDTFGSSGNTLFSVGNGTALNERHNAFEIRQNGDIYIVNKDGNDVKLQDEIGNITVDQVLDNTTSASTNPVSSKAVYDAVTDNELVWTNAFVALSGAVSSHTENTEIHVTADDKDRWDNAGGGFSAITNPSDSTKVGLVNKLSQYYDTNIGKGAVIEGDGFYNQYTENTYNIVASGDYSHAEGSNTTASGYGSHAEGSGAKASGNYSHAEGNNTTASGSSSHAEGARTQAAGSCSHAEGNNTTASGSSSHAEGDGTTANGNYSHAEGSGTKANGNYSHAEGMSTSATGVYSHAEGSSTQANGPQSHAEGGTTVANNWAAHAEGQSTLALGERSHAEGGYTRAEGSDSHAEGYYTVANNASEHASGMYNISSTGSTDDAKTLFTIGNGTAENARHNAFEIRKNGDIYISSGGTNTSPMIKLQDSLGVDLSNYYTKSETSGTTELATAFAAKANTSDIANFFDDAKYEDSGSTKVINFYHGNTIKATIDATDFIVDGMVDDVKIENGYLVIDFNTASGKQDISIPLTDIFDPSNYYNKTAIDNLVGSGFTSSSITEVIIENEEIVSAALTDLDGRIGSGFSVSSVTEVVESKADKTEDLDGVKLKKITQSAYDALVQAGTTDPNTLYVITDNNS